MNDEEPCMANDDVDRNCGVPLKQQLRQWVLRQIAEGSTPVGSCIPSINALAQRFGVARDTVRLSLETLVQDGILMPARGRGYFVREREQREHRIALLGKLDGVYIRPIYTALTERLGQRATVMLIDIRRLNPAEMRTIESLAYHQAVDRVLVVPMRGQEDELDRVLEPYRRYFEVAWLDRAPTARRDAAFICNYERCVDLALEHLYASGITNHVYFSRHPEDGSVFSVMRRRYRQFQEKCGHRPLVLKRWQAVVRRAQNGRIGVITDTDHDAVYLQSHLLSEGINVPDHVSIISSDNSAILELVNPPLTSVDPGFSAIGQHVANWILQDRSITPGPITYTPTPAIVFRGSCLPLASASNAHRPLPVR